MTITVKGQITIPQALREQFGLLPGTEVDFVAGEVALEVRFRRRNRKARTAFDGWLAKAEGSARIGQTTDQMLALTRGEN